MNSFNPEQFEAELNRLRPARPPRELLDRISNELQLRSARFPQLAQTKRPAWNLRALGPWLAPACAVLALGAAFYLGHQRARSALAQKLRAPGAPAGVPTLKADQVEIDRQLLADFDAVADLPSGEPIRFRCEQWMDKVRWRDSAKGVAFEQTIPRLEIVPVRLETY